MKSDAQKFIDNIKTDALKSQAKAGIPASVIIAQAGLETAFGKRLCIDVTTKKNSKNLFNIKGTGPAGYVECWTTEYYNGVRQKVMSKFRAYNTFEESFNDHANLLQKPRYQPCLAVKDKPREFAQKLQQCGYATDPKYGQKLIKIMDFFKLEEVTMVQEKIPVIIDSKNFEGLLIEETAYVPVRTAFEALGFQVNWDISNKNVTVVNLSPKTEPITVLFEGNKFDGILVNQVSFGPLRVLFESIGYKVTWDDNTKTVSINKA